MVTPTWSWLLTRWDLEPSIVVGLAVLGAGYLYLCGYLPRPRAADQRVRRVHLGSPAQLCFFLSSLAVLALALLSPLDAIGDEYLFSAHMIQHLLLASVFPPLLLLGIPEPLVTPWLGGARAGRVMRGLAFPAIVFLVFNLDITIWHLPAWYDATLTNQNIHIVEHLSFMAAGILVWWPVLSPIRSQRLSPGMQELYLFANLFPMMALGIFFSFWQHPLYAPYVAAPRLWGISPLTDQQIGGLIMWMPGDAPYALAMACILVAWFDRGDPVEQRRVWVRPVEEGTG
jgi:putative membrane protein